MNTSTFGDNLAPFIPRQPEQERINQNLQQLYQSPQQSLSRQRSLTQQPGARLSASVPATDWRRSLADEQPSLAPQIQGRVQDKKQMNLWKLLLVLLLVGLLVYIFYRLYQDSTYQVDSIVNGRAANDLVKQGINLKNFVDMF